jgi:hypothetical protein
VVAAWIEFMRDFYGVERGMKGKIVYYMVTL